MKRVRVLVPFTDRVSGKPYKKDDEIDLTEERIAEVKAVSVNMILVLGDSETQKEVSEEEPKKKTTRKKKAE